MAGYAHAVEGRSIVADFSKFSSKVPLQRLHMPRTDSEWTYYQVNASTGLEPLVFLHGTSSTAGAFFYQVDALGAKGYRAISAQYPAYDTIEDWIKGFDHFLDALKCRGAHVCGAGLGGLLAQQYASRHAQRVRSLVLCNSFASTHLFAEQAGTLASVVSIMPTPLLRKVMLDAFPEAGMELAAKQAIDWVAQQVNDLSGADLASRLALNCTGCFVGELQLPETKISILESSGETMVPEELRRELRRRYPQARVSNLKAMGDFPYLAQPEEATLFVEVHLRGVGLYPGGQVPSAPAEAESLVLPDGSARTSEEDWYYSHEQDDQTRWGVRGIEVASEPRLPARRPIWKNPFEDDPLL